MINEEFREFGIVFVKFYCESIGSTSLTMCFSVSPGIDFAQTMIEGKGLKGISFICLFVRPWHFFWDKLWRQIKPLSQNHTQ